MKGTTMQPKCEWGFSAEPDYARICRELADQGAKVGRVTIKGLMAQTLFHDSARPIGRFISATAVNGAPGWSRASGDHVAALIPKHPPVKVEGFAPLPKPAPKPTVYEPYGIFCKTGQRSLEYPRTYPNQEAAAADLKNANGYFARAL